MVRFSHVALLAALGCSPVKDFSNVPDAPVDADTPAEITSSAPEDGAMKVSVLTPISVFFNVPLDPASVDATTVKLSYRRWPATFLGLGGNYYESPEGPGQAGPTFVRGTVSYDEIARKVSFVPAAPLPYGTTLTLSLDVKDRAGRAATASVTFTTYVNGNTKEFFFSGSTGAPIEWRYRPTDMNGRTTKYVRTTNPGNDGIWFTADDPRTVHHEFLSSPDGRVLEERLYSVGQDGWGDTSDDYVSRCYFRTYSAQNVLTEIAWTVGPGPDSVWCTSDDEPLYVQAYKHTGDSVDSMIMYFAPGTDNLWRTPDDRCDYYWDFTNDDRGNRVREVLRYCSTDGLPNTADDVLSQYYEYEYDADGNVTRTTRKSGPGPDTEWLTDDDVITRVTRYVRNADGQVTETFDTSSPGADMMWGTADDPGTRVVYTYNAQKLVEEITTYNGFGNDGMWGTDDDVISRYSKLTYDANGNRNRQKDYNAGPDGMWKNEDDRIILDYQFDLDR